MYQNSGGLTSSFRFILRNYAIELKVGMGKRNGILAKERYKQALFRQSEAAA